MMRDNSPLIARIHNPKLPSRRPKWPGGPVAFASPSRPAALLRAWKQLFRHPRGIPVEPTLAEMRETEERVSKELYPKKVQKVDKGRQQIQQGR